MLELKTKTETVMKPKYLTLFSGKTSKKKVKSLTVVVCTFRAELPVERLSRSK